MLSSLPKVPYRFVAALTGVMAFPLASPVPAQAQGSPNENAATSAAASSESASAQPGESASQQDDGPDEADGDIAASTSDPKTPEQDGNACLVKTVCSVKQNIRWQSPAWTPASASASPTRSPRPRRNTISARRCCSR